MRDLAGPPRKSALSNEEREAIRVEIEDRVREEVAAMRPLDAGERDLLRAALPPTRTTKGPPASG